MNKREKLNLALSYFDELFPHAHCELNYRRDYELVIAVMLSAQTTDESVNFVTAKLFSRFPSLNALANAAITDLENEIRTLGLFRNKAKNIKGIAHKLISDFSGKVPRDKAALMELPGVGNKTANVIRAELFRIPEFAVDTHVARVSKRLGFVKPSDDVDAIEKKMRKLLPEEKYIKTHHQMIHFGRYFCKARQPNCQNCRLREICQEKNKKI
ncbi:MAG: endonuclease III [Bacilli bacterium]|jgi:endonuclease-3